MKLEKNLKTRALAKKLLALEDKIKGKPFPNMVRAREISNYSCGPAVLQMLLSFVGVKASQLGMIRSLRAQKRIKIYGIDTKDMAKVTRIVGEKSLSFWRKHNATVNDLSYVVNKFKYPVGVEWRGDFFENEDEDKGHYAVVTKIDKNAGEMRMSDPYFNTFFAYNNLDRKYKISEFVKIWWDTNPIFVAGSSKPRWIKDVKTMFVITPKEVTWPKKVGMVRI